MLKGIRRGIFNYPLYYIVAVATINRACKLEGIDIIVILYFKAKYLKYNILEFYLDSFKLNIRLV